MFISKMLRCGLTVGYLAQLQLNSGGILQQMKFSNILANLLSFALDGV
jgi:hypothetical protein